MDSGNSGSMQSSSGGDEEFDSRAAFLTTTSTNPPPPNSSALFFDPLSNYLSAAAADHPFTTTRPSPPNPNSDLLMMNNLDMGWPSSSSSRATTQRSHDQHNYTTTHFNNTSLMAASSSSTSTTHDHHHQPMLMSTTPHQQHHHHGSATFPPLQTNQTGPNSTGTTTGLRASSSSSSPLLHPPDHHQRVNSPKNPKKRSRASRRAPTHVLTTDTSNFRAMVQEFTGIPAPPFSASPFPRTRFDLFNTSSTATTTMRSGLDQPPSYLLRPFAQKPHPPPSFLSSSSSAAATTNTVTPPVTNNTSTSTAAPNNYQLFSELGLSKQSPHHQNLLNMQNPPLTFQSLLQSASSPPSHLHHPHPSATHNSQLKMGVLEQFGTQLGSGMNPNLVLRSDDNNNNNNNNTSSWGDGGGGGGGSNNGDHNLRSFNGNYDNSQRATVNGCNKMNYTLGTSSSEFIAEKGSENINSNSNNNVNSSRGEGMVDSWICSSD